MNEDDLEAFRVVAEELSFTRAARRLEVTVSAVSQRVRRLEHDLGVVLLTRTTRTVALTDKGLILLDGAQQRAALDQRIRMSITARAASPDTPHPQTLGISRVDATGLLAYLDDAEPAPPGAEPWRISSFPEATAGLTAVVQDDIDCLLWSDWDDLRLSRVPAEITGQIASKIIFDEPLWVYLAADHPHAASAEIAWADLAEQPWIAPSDVIARQVLLRAARTLGGFEPQINYVTDDPRLSAELIRSGRALDLGPPAAEPIPGIVMRPLSVAPVTRIRVSAHSSVPASYLGRLAAVIRTWYLDSARDDNPDYWQRLLRSDQPAPDTA